MIGIIEINPGEYHAFINIAEEDIKDAVIVDGHEDAINFLGSLSTLSNEAADSMEGLLTTIYKMGVEHGKNLGTKSPQSVLGQTKSRKLNFSQ